MVHKHVVFAWRDGRFFLNINTTRRGVNRKACRAVWIGDCHQGIDLDRPEFSSMLTWYTGVLNVRAGVQSEVSLDW